MKIISGIQEISLIESMLASDCIGKGGSRSIDFLESGPLEIFLFESSPSLHKRIKGHYELNHVTAMLLFLTPSLGFLLGISIPRAMGIDKDWFFLITVDWLCSNHLA